MSFFSKTYVYCRQTERFLVKFWETLWSLKFMGNDRELSWNFIKFKVLLKSLSCFIRLHCWFFISGLFQFGGTTHVHIICNIWLSSNCSASTVRPRRGGNQSPGTYKGQRMTYGKSLKFGSTIIFSWTFSSKYVFILLILLILFFKLS